MIEDDSAARRAAARAAVQLQFKHDPELPITARREAILKALTDRQVLIVAGDTGSGKSTQLPQYCLELGRGMAGLIAHTQPRRPRRAGIGRTAGGGVGPTSGPQRGI